MENNFDPNRNTEGWEYSLEAILAEYTAETLREAPAPAPEPPRRPISMEPAEEGLALSGESSEDFPEEVAPRRGLRLLRRRRGDKSSAAAPEAESEIPVIPTAPEASEPSEALPEKQAVVYNICDIVAEVRSAAAQEAKTSAGTEAPGAVTDKSAAPEAPAVSLTGDEDTAYAPEPEYPQPEEEPEEAPGFESRSKHPSLLVSLMAVLLIRRQQRQAKAREEAQAAPIPEEAPEVSLKAASKFYVKAVNPYRLRFLLSALVCLILLYISWGLPLLGAMKSPRVCAGMCMTLELCVMLLGLDVFSAGMTALFRGKPGLTSLAAVSCVCSVLDALIIFLGGPGQGLPYCGVSALTICLALFGERLRCMGMARSFHTAAAAAEPTVVSSEEKVLPEGRALLKSSRSLRGFVNRAQESDAVETAYSLLSPILLVAAPVLALLASVGRKAPGDFFHCLSALTAVSASFSAFLSFTLPYSVVARRLASVGAALAGWAGCADMGESRRIVVTDGDLFPPGNVVIDTIRILEGVYTDKVLSYAGSVVAFSGCGLTPAFQELLRRNGCALHQVENFSCHLGGGLTAIVRGEQVFVGCSSFMNLMGIRLPQSQMSSTSVFVAISGELVGVFSIRYVPTASVQEALVSLLRARGAEPLFAVRDFNISPLLLKQRFRMPTEGFDFPPFPERYRISALSSDEKNPPAAVLVRKGLAPYVEAAQAGRSLYRGSRLCLLLSLLCSVLGMLLMFFLCVLGAYDSASAGNILLFMLLWLVPVIIVALGLGR